jgi:hypothetical protein
MAEPTYSESMRGNAAISTAVPRGLVDTSCLRLRIRRLRCRSVYRAFQNVCEELPFLALLLHAGSVAKARDMLFGEDR